LYVFEELQIDRLFSGDGIAIVLRRSNVGNSLGADPSLIGDDY
jgi:hypothetical protein